jgi:hypothetical protein
MLTLDVEREKVTTESSSASSNDESTRIAAGIEKVRLHNERGQGCLEAVSIWRPLAEHGSPDAQVLLAEVYSGDDAMWRGHGCPWLKNDSEAAVWWLRAAEQGVRGAQYHVGLWYAVGHAFSVDYISAYLWLDLSAERYQVSSPRDAWIERDCLAKVMTPDEIRRAQAKAEPQRQLPRHALTVVPDAATYPGFYPFVDPQQLPAPDEPGHAHLCSEIFQARAKRGPEHSGSVRDEIDAREKTNASNLIRSELDAVAQSGRYTALPAPARERAAGLGLGVVQVIENRTSYSLRVAFSGPADRETTIDPGATQTVSLPAGTYRVLGRVDAPNVLPFYGQQKYDSGMKYTSQFFVGTTDTP